MFAPLRAGHVIARIQHVLATGFAEPPRIVFEKLNPGAAMRAGNFINVVQLPVTQVLSRAIELGHGRSPSVARLRIRKQKDDDACRPALRFRPLFPSHHRRAMREMT
jgi:hypothetical protein